MHNRIIIVKIKKQYQNFASITIECKDYRNYDHEAVITEVLNVSWDAVLESNDVNTAWYHFHNKIIDIVDRNAPRIRNESKVNAVHG